MNQTTAAAANASSGLSFGSYGTLTAIHLIVIGLFALLVIAAIVYGARSKRRRVAADEAVVDHAAEAGVTPTPPDPAEPSLPADRATMPAPSALEPAEPEQRPVADEPIPAAAPLTAAPAIEAASAPAPAPAPQVSGPADGPVTQLKGLGPKVAARLGELGVTTVGQIAALTDDEADALDVQLGAFRGRMTRDRWIEQARFLAAGDRAGFEAVFGKL